MSILKHPKWEEFVPHLHLERVKNGERERIEVDGGAPLEVTTAMLAACAPCAHCQVLINVFRSRQTAREVHRVEKSYHIYYASACAQANNYSCSRTTKAASEMDRVREAVRLYQIRIDDMHHEAAEIRARTHTTH